jgi:hypothetical protein
MTLINEEMELRLLLIDNDPVQSKVKSFALSKHFDIVRVKKYKGCENRIITCTKTR